MTRGSASLSAEERALLDDEVCALARVNAALAQARAAQEQARAEARFRPDQVEVVRALQREAGSAAEDDLPALLHELSVRQTLLARPATDPLPDPNSPYLAHLIVREGGLEKDYFLGQKSLLDAKAGVRVVDWRVSPVARIFYGYREGDEYEEEFPGRVAEGTIVARRIVVIERGELRQVVTPSAVLACADDGTWSSQPRNAFALRGGGAGNAARSDAATLSHAPHVTALLDAEQFAAINAPADRPLLVLGSAGSGKTTVALHRLARLAASDPERFPLERVRVVVPEEGLARLSRRLLEPLGVGTAQVSTIDGWAIALATRVFEQRLPRLCADAPALVANLKRHPALYRALRARFAGKKPSAKPSSLKQLRRKLAELFSDRAFLSEVVHGAGGTLSRAAIEDTVRHTLLQLGDSIGKQTAAITDRTRLHTVDGRSLGDGTPEDLAQTLDLEELPILLCLRAWQGTLALPESALAHLVLDEAEDFSAFDLHVLGKQLGLARSVTLARDEAQQTSASFAGWEAALTELGVGAAERCRLAVSYRCPAPIFELAQRVLGPLASPQPKSSARAGAPVGYFRFPSAAQAELLASGEARDLALREPGASIALICAGAQSARRCHALLPEGAGARLVLAGDFTFEPGIDVTNLDSVKGLEFDYVIVPDASANAYPESDEARRRLHVAVTRAVSELWLIAGGQPSPLVGELAEPGIGSRN